MSTAAKSLIVVAAVALTGLAVFSYDQARTHTTVKAAQPAATTAAGSTKINACSLLTEAEVEQTVGAKVGPPQRSDEGEVGGREHAPMGTYSSTCIWEFAADKDTLDPLLPLGGKRFAILSAMTWPTNKDAASFLQSFRDAFKDDIIPSEPIPLSLGDEALWWGDGTAIRKGKVSIGMSVFLQNGDKPTQRKMEEALARKILPRI